MAQQGCRGTFEAITHRLHAVNLESVLIVELDKVSSLSEMNPSRDAVTASRYGPRQYHH